MAEARRRVRLACDATPLATGQPDIDARIGWLLSVSRLHHPEPLFGDLRRFPATLRDHGCAADRATVTTWEAGRIPVPYQAMVAYEAALGLQNGRISSLTGYIRSALPGVRAHPARPTLDPAHPGFRQRLGDLLDRADQAAAAPGEWQELGWHLAAAPDVDVSARTWQHLAHQIVNLLPRGVRVAYRQYSTAAMDMASLPAAQDFLVDAIDAYRNAPGVQVLMNPVGMLDRLPTRRSASIVLDLMEDPPHEPAYRQAVWLATQKLIRGDFSADERSRLHVIVLRIWRADPAKAGEDLGELIASLPAGVRSTLTVAASQRGLSRLGFLVEHGEDLGADRAGVLAARLAEKARGKVPPEPSYHEDPMLPRLIREAMFHRDSERRHLAALLISASPFAEAVTDELLALLAGTGSPPRLRVRAATLVRYLGESEHRLRLTALLDDDAEGVAVAVAQAIGHIPYAALSDQAVRRSLRPTWSMRERARLYALGMTGSPALPALAGSGTAPQWQRTAARWWLALGPAIRNQARPSSVRR